MKTKKQENSIENLIDDKALEQERQGDKTPILLVEDNLEVLDFLKRILKQDYSIYTATDGIKALEILNNKKIELVLSDIMMEEMDGLELCRKIKENIDISHIPIVLLTAKTDVGTKLDSLEVGIDAYIEKPFSPIQVKAQLKNILDKREELKKRFATSPIEDVKITTHNKLDEEFAEECLNVIHENIDDPSFSIDVIIREVGMSRTALFSKLKAITGMTPNELIKVTRLKAAGKLLIEGQYRISEIGYLVGFNSPSYFSKCFVKQFGVLPSEFVESHKKT